jgi:hypothetical protein
VRRCAAREELELVDQREAGGQEGAVEGEAAAADDVALDLPAHRLETSMTLA